MIELTVVDSERETCIPAKLIRAVFGFTEAESLIAQQLARGASIGDAAAHLGITRRTAYLHLEHIYRKAGVHGHAELVRALLAPFFSAAPGHEAA